jgi:hypothetical protein
MLGFCTAELVFHSPDVVFRGEMPRTGDSCCFRSEQKFTTLVALRHCSFAMSRVASTARGTQGAEAAPLTDLKRSFDELRGWSVSDAAL